MANQNNQEKSIEKSFDLDIMKRLYNYSKSFMGLFIFCILLLGVTTAVDLSKPYLIKMIIDDHVIPYDRPMYPVYSDSETEDHVFNDIRLEYGKKSSFDNRSEVYQILKVKDNYYFIEGYLNDYDQDLIKLDGNTVIYNNQSYETILLTSEEYQAFREYDKSGIVQLALTFLGLLVMGFIVNFVQIYILHYVSQKQIMNMRRDLFAHLENMNLGFFDKNPVGRLVTRVTNDMKNINDMYTNVLVNSFKDIFLLLGTIIIMVSINWKLALISLSTVPFILFAAYIFRIKAREAQRAVKVKLARINATLSENITGMKIIQIFNREKEVFDEFDEINKDHLTSSLKETLIYAIFRPTMNLTYSVSLALLLWFGGGQAIQSTVELGVIVAFINYTEQFFRPIFDLSEKFNILQSAMASSERIFMLFDEENPIEEKEDAKEFTEEIKQITFEDVRFSYNEKEEVLKGINFEVNKGETVAIVGATGSGKTTIISLLSRFYDVQGGAIKANGEDIKNLKKHDLRSKIGIVLQDVFLFAGNIIDNIKLNNDLSLEEVERIATYVNADHFISRLPDKYYDPVQERGATFSAGQRQLLSFARALAYNPELLILDEATSNIDTETELLIQDAIKKLIQDRTTIIIAHRLSTIRNADKIIVLNKGEIKEMGTHDELISKQGLYYDLYLLQYSS